MMSVLLSFQQFDISAVAAASEVPNLELDFKALQQEVLSGKTADFELNVKVTGSQTTLTNGKLVVILPKHPEVPVTYSQIPNGVPDATLTIAGVSPIYNAQNATLTYNFKELKSGQVYKTIIQAVPELGKTPVSDKEKNLEADASVKVDQYADALNSGKKTTKVISNGAVSANTTTSETAKESTATSETAKESTATSETAKESTATSETAKESFATSGTEKESTATSETAKESFATSGTEKESTTTSETAKESTATSETEKESTTTSETAKESTATSETEKESTTTSETAKGSTATSETEKESTTTSETAKGSTTTLKTAVAFNATLGTANLELYLNSLQQEVLSGKTANYELNVKVTGSQTTLTNGQMVVNLPKHPEVPIIYPQIQNGVPNETLTIDGVSPIYNAQNGTLTYNFPELVSGQVYKTIIQVIPELGKTPVSDKDKNIRNLESNASIKVDQYAEALDSGKKTTMVISNGAVGISKTYTSTKKYSNNSWTLSTDAPVQGDLGGWTIKASIPKTDAGLSYIQENGKIRIVDQIPAGLVFDSTLQDSGFTGVYNSSNNTVTWEFDAPTFAEQELVSINGNLFTKELKINLKFDSSIPDFSTITNTATATYQPYRIGNISNISTSGSSDIMIASGGGPTPDVNGQYYYGVHRGPLDGSSGKINNDNNNLNYIPTVTDEAYLRFFSPSVIGPYGMNYRINSGAWQNNNSQYPYQQIIDSGYKTYTMEYTIDSKLDLTELLLVKPYEFYNTSVAKRPLTQIPDTFVQLKINGVWKSEYPIQFPISNQVGTNTGKLDVTQFGKDGHVEAFRVIYRNASGKMYGTVNSFYNVVKGAVGQTANSVKNYFELNDGTKIEREPIDDSSPMGNRHVNIVQNSSEDPLVQSSIQFVDSGGKPLTTGSNVQRGNNRIQIQFQNNAASQANITGPLELVALLPKGINILDQPNMLYSNNSVNPTYQVIGEVNGQQQIKFTWDNQRLLPGEKITANFDVDVTRTALSNLELQVYGFSANTGLQVPTSQGNVYTKSVLETDTNDLNQNGNTTQPRVKSANKYSIVKNDNLQIMKQVKGSLDDEFSLFGYTNPDGDVTYRFNLTNTTNEIIEQFMFLDVLPSVGDLGITDNTERGSKFETTLKGPISFAGTKWQDQVTVYYSMSKNPKRDDLYATVDYSVGSTPQPNPAGAEDPNWMLASAVTNWNDIHSFKIVMNDGVQWLEGQDIQFDVEAKAPALPVDTALFDEKTPEVDRAAWNSFAVTTNELLAVEPLRVGVIMKAQPGSLEITKVDDQTGKVLSGATFELRKYESDSSTQYSVIASGTTDGVGKLLLKDIPLGSYKLVETKAPNDHMLLRDPIDVNITTSGEVVKLTVKNSKIGWEIPKTGGIGTTLFYGIGVLLMITALFLLLRKRSRNK
ncbi:SpaA isopeptide-forming pilin-related protein [Lysinibacillus agricola]